MYIYIYYTNISIHRYNHMWPRPWLLFVHIVGMVFKQCISMIHGLSLWDDHMSYRHKSLCKGYVFEWNRGKMKVSLYNEGKLDIPFWCNGVLEIAHIKHTMAITIVGTPGPIQQTLASQLMFLIVKTLYKQTVCKLEHGHRKFADVPKTGDFQ